MNISIFMVMDVAFLSVIIFVAWIQDDFFLVLQLMLSKHFRNGFLLKVSVFRLASYIWDINNICTTILGEGGFFGHRIWRCLRLLEFDTEITHVSIRFSSFIGKLWIFKLQLLFLLILLEEKRRNTWKVWFNIFGWLIVVVTFMRDKSIEGLNPRLGSILRAE